MWVEVNARVNYPIKTVLIQMEQRDQLNLNCNHERYCISWFTMRVAHIGTTSFVQAWNNHRIPGKQKYIVMLCVVHSKIVSMRIHTFKGGWDI